MNPSLKTHPANELALPVSEPQIEASRRAGTAPNWIIFLLVCAIYLAITYFERNFLYDASTYYRSFSSQLDETRIDDILALQSRFMWIVYVAVPLLLVLRLALTAACLYCGFLLSNSKVSFNKLFIVVTRAELIFVVVAILRCLWFAFAQPEHTVQEIAAFSPASLLNLFSLTKDQQWLEYPLKTINLFEVAYVIILARILQVKGRQPFVKSLNTIAGSYGLGLLIWMLAAMFLYITFLTF